MVSSAAHLPPLPAFRHQVQFYEQERFLREVVAAFLGEGLSAGAPVVVVASRGHREAFCQALVEAGFDVASAVGAGQLTLLDARETLTTFMVDDVPDRERFLASVGSIVADCAARGPIPVRVYGEMVDLLTRDGHGRAAFQLEELWNELGQRLPFVLFCAYAMDGFASDSQRAHFQRVCDGHTHVAPAEDFVGDSDPQALRRQISLLQQRSRALETELERRNHLEAELRRTVRFSEMFVGILGHDLRNPVSAVSTAASLLLRRSQDENIIRPARRILSSADRMSRMIDQLLDFTSIRLGRGLPLIRRRIDLSHVCRAVTDELESVGSAGGRPRIAVEVAGDAVGDWDGDRLAQLLSNLIGNAQAHGQDPITLRIDGQDEDQIGLDLSNGGVIPREILPVLFEPLRMAPDRKEVGSSGLGLGLYISQQIVLAHGGTIDVASSPAFGTRFIIRLPRQAPEGTGAFRTLGDDGRRA